MNIFARIAAVLFLVSLPVAELTSVVAADTPVPALDVGAPRFSDQMPPIDVGIAQDGVDAKGAWTQVVRLTVKSGGTLAEASLIVFGDAIHVDTIFAAAKRQNPRLYSPAMVPLGQVIDVPIAPATTFALTAVLHQPNALVQRFSNGAIETIYQKPEGNLVHVITFPDGAPTDLFVYPSGQGPVKVKPGGKIVDVSYVPGTSLGDTVRQIYGLTTYQAAADLNSQTGWNPTHWPPSPGELHRIVVGPSATYRATPAEVQPIPNPDPAGRARQQSLRLARSQVGITTVRLESFGQVYQIAVSDPSFKASDVANLVYGSPNRIVDVAKAAGFQIPGSGPFDPVLFGRSFDLSVDYIDEQIVIHSNPTPDGGSEALLADGAMIRIFPADSVGPLRVVVYPTGYKRVLYRPPAFLLSIANGLALFNAANDLSLSSTSTDSLSRRYAAEVIWRWGPSVPRQSGDLTDSIDLIDDPHGAYIDALVAPPLPRTAIQRAFDALDPRNPAADIAGLVTVATVLVVLADGLRRVARYRRQVRW